MKHQGKALSAAAAHISKAVLAAIFLAGFASLVWPKSFLAAAVFVFLGLVFAVFCLWFFRDPNPQVPSGTGLVVSPAHGTVDVIDETEEPIHLGGRCKRVSIFLSVFDVHVQQAPVSGTVLGVKHTPGKFLNALKTESAAHNENVLIGIRSAEPGQPVIGVRLIAGLIARRIIPWLAPGETIERGERISLIQFGSRLDLYLPLNAEVVVRLGDRVRGGETVMAHLK